MTIPQYLQRHGLKPAQFARLVGVSRAVASRWAKGEQPRGQNINKVVEATRGEITANEILGITLPPAAAATTTTSTPETSRVDGPTAQLNAGPAGEPADRQEPRVERDDHSDPVEW